ncbi:hypothetical protein [Nostoc flagelliforme]|uniref:hypothetical protein n=1 Tax=Nostoc flagelliforme TaxID=1306274 RepID=UPI0012FDE145|nr:hypothetical protein [Nostoc flagelliforme]
MIHWWPQRSQRGIFEANFNVFAEKVLEILNELDQKLLDESGDMLLHPIAFYDELDRTELRIWCSHRGRYTLPTVELVAWLREVIGRRTCIEIAAGKGDLARHLGIKATDSYMQEIPLIKGIYEKARQATTNPPADVERLEASEAIAKYRPQVVLGSWVSGQSLATVAGVDEEYVVSHSDYIHIGNRGTHEQKSLREMPHEEYVFPFITRAKNPNENVIWVWRK